MARVAGTRRRMKLLAIGKRSVKFIHPVSGLESTMRRSDALHIVFKNPADAIVTLPDGCFIGATVTEEK